MTKVDHERVHSRGEQIEGGLLASILHFWAAVMHRGEFVACFHTHMRQFNLHVQVVGCTGRFTQVYDALMLYGKTALK